MKETSTKTIEAAIDRIITMNRLTKKGRAMIVQGVKDELDTVALGKVIGQAIGTGATYKYCAMGIYRVLENQK